MNKKVLLFLAQGFEKYETGVFTDVLGWSRVLLTSIENVNAVKKNMRFRDK